LGKDLPGMWKPKTRKNRYSHIRHSRFYGNVSQNTTYYILTKGKIQQDVTILNIYAPNIHKTNTSELKGTDRTRYNNCGQTHPTPSIDRTSRQKISKDILELNNTFDKMDLADIYRVFHPLAADYTFFSAAHGTFSTIDPHPGS
jgi:hypothetical protein